jgi:hypothetical protein
MYPIKMYHRDHEAFVRSGREQYPIVVHNQEEADALEPGWCADPVAAAEWVAEEKTVEVPESSGESVTDNEDEDELGDELDDESLDDTDDAEVTEVDAPNVAPKKKRKKKNR